MSNRKSLLSWLNSFLPAGAPVNGKERLRAACGMALGLFATGVLTRLVLGPGAHLPLLIAPMGASAVLLFAVPASPLAQPWSVIGGNLVASVVGVTSIMLIHDPVQAAAVAGGVAILGMFALRCVHPPSGAIALTAVLGGPAITSLGYGFVFVPVLLNSVLIMTVALVYNNSTGRRYPHVADAPKPGSAPEVRVINRLGFKPEDLDPVLKQYNQVLDVARDDLESLFLQTELQAYRRRFGEILCRDIMAPDVAAVEFGTPLAQAWKLMRRTRFSALPVVDDARRVIGILTLADFMGHAGLDDYDSLSERLRRWLRPARVDHGRSNQAQVAGELMTTPARTAQRDMHISELVPMLSDQGWHHLPVVDDKQCLVGILTQSDLIAALYRGRLGDAMASDEGRAASGV